MHRSAVGKTLAASRCRVLQQHTPSRRVFGQRKAAMQSLRGGIMLSRLPVRQLVRQANAGWCRPPLGLRAAAAAAE